MEGTGSSFHFTVRFGLPTGPVAERIPETFENLAGLRVLVVDDNATNRRILEEILTSWRLKPSSADSGPTALQMVARAREAGEAYALILLDCNMPVMDGFQFAAELKERPAPDSATIMMLTSSGQRGDAVRCRELGISAYLTKPVRQSSLLDAIMTVLGKTSTGASPPLVTRHLLPKRRRSLRILLAEDNAVNRKIAVAMLGKRGHTVATVSDGQAAVTAFEGETVQPFDLILMDVQMPVMDGLKATALIREKERGTGRHIPIIALTAHAMKGDREICLEAGMDGYITKPLNEKELCAAMDQAMQEKADPARRPARAAGGGTGGRALFDPEQALVCVDGDRELLSEVAGLFWDECPRLLAEIHDAAESGDCAALERAAHRLKGSVSNFGARSASALAMKLEMMGRGRNLEGAAEAAAGLVEELELLKDALNDFVGRKRT
jgi:CheY-like chemotaxis protein/HPt (histidine-containing phosphotransfer) domain-containing protein